MFPPNILYFAIFWKFINGSLSLVLSITSLENHIFHQKDVLEVALSTDILDTINPKVRIVQWILTLGLSRCDLFQQSFFPFFLRIPEGLSFRYAE